MKRCLLYFGVLLLPLPLFTGCFWLDCGFDWEPNTLSDSIAVDYRVDINVAEDRILVLPPLKYGHVEMTENGAEAVDISISTSEFHQFFKMSSVPLSGSISNVRLLYDGPASFIYKREGV